MNSDFLFNDTHTLDTDRTISPSTCIYIYIYTNIFTWMFITDMNLYVFFMNRLNMYRQMYIDISSCSQRFLSSPSGII